VGVRSEEADHDGAGCGSGPCEGGLAVDPGKVTNRVWVSNGAGLIADPVSLSVARDEISRALGDQGGSSPGTWCRGRRVILRLRERENASTAQSWNNPGAAWVQSITRYSPGPILPGVGSGDSRCATMLSLRRTGGGSCGPTRRNLPPGRSAASAWPTSGLGIYRPVRAISSVTAS